MGIVVLHNNVVVTTAATKTPRPTMPCAAVIGVTRHGKCPCVGESRVGSPLISFRLGSESPVCSFDLGPILCCLQNNNSCRSIYLRRRMSDNDDIEVDSDVSIFIFAFTLHVCSISLGTENEPSCIFDT